MHLLHYYFLIFLVISCFMVFFAKNPVHSVLFLILSFINAAFILLLFKVEFLALLFIIIYVGAIAILFLFIVMMLNIKKDVFSLKLNDFFIPFALSSFFLIFIVFDFTFLENWGLFNYQFNFISVIIDSFFDINVFGQALYNYYLSLVLIGGFILLIAMVGAIVLTFEFKSIYLIENSFRQLSRTNNTMKVFF